MHYYDTNDLRRKEQLTNQGLKTVPQIWHDGMHIGGFTELKDYLSA
jgi:glutaredoxin